MKESILQFYKSIGLIKIRLEFNFDDINAINLLF